MLATVAVVLLACTRIDTSDPQVAPEEPTGIGFSSYTPRQLTRANDSFVDGNALASGKQFAVYAWQTDYGEFLTANPGPPTFMNPAVVTWSGDDNSGSGNSYEPKRYWPSGDNPANLSFTAYYPYAGSGIMAPTFDANTAGVYVFAAQASSAAMVDFCVADVVNDQVYGHTNKTASGHKGSVNFSFKHMLTKVQFRFRTTDIDENTTVKLVEAQLKNIRTTGTLTATFTRHMDTTDPEHPVPAPGVNILGTTDTDWSGQAIAAPPITYDLTLNNSNPTPNTNEITLDTDLNTVHNNDIFLMVPQEMVPRTGTNPQYLEITWKVTTDGVTTTNTKKLYLDDCVSTSGPEPAGIDWEKNRFVTYTITIGPAPIYFTGAVSNWSTGQNGYFNAH